MHKKDIQLYREIKIHEHIFFYIYEFGATQSHQNNWIIDLFGFCKEISKKGNKIIANF